MGGGDQLNTHLVDADGDGVREVFNAAANNDGSVSERWLSASRMDGNWSRSDTGLLAPTLDLNSFRYWFADVNGDGLQDALKVNNSGGGISVALNTGSGFTTPAAWQMEKKSYVAQLAQHRDDSGFWGWLPWRDGTTTYRDPGLRIADMDGDGRDDVILLGGNDGAPGLESWDVRSRGSKIRILKPHINGFSAVDLDIKLVGDGSARNHQAQVLDVNGDGLVDLIQSNGALQLYIHKGKKADVLTAITDGYGMRTDITYEPISNSAVYTQNSQPGCSYPQLCVNRGLWVVSNQKTTNPGWEQRSFNFTYADARTHVAGRGWLGFGRRTIADPARSARGVGAVTTLTYDLSKNRRLGMPTSVEELIPVSDDVTYQRKTTNQISTVQTAQGVWGIESVTSTTTEKEFAPVIQTPDSVASLRGRTVTVNYDLFGNLVWRVELGGLDPLHPTTVTTEQIDYWPFQEDLWFVGLPKQTTIGSSAGGYAGVRMSQFTYDNYGQLATETVEPIGPNTMTRQFTRNAEGMIELTSEWLPSGETRSSTIKYDGLDGAFPVLTTNAAGHLKSAVYHNGYGLVASQTDENGNKTYFQYDTFGRPKSRDASDASDLTITYQKYPNMPFVTQTMFATGGVEERQFDRLGREVVRWWVGAGGGTISAATHYDQLGRAVATSTPQFTATQAPARWNWTTLDNLDRPIEFTRSDGSKRSWQRYERTTVVRDYDVNLRIEQTNDAGQLTSVREGAVTSSYSYGPFGVLLDMNDEFLNTVHREHDAYGRLTKIVDPDRGTTIYRYDGFGNLFWSEDATGRRIFEYDRLGRTTREIDPEYRERTWHWDTAANGIGKLHWKQSADGVTDTLSYDLKARLATMTRDFASESDELRFTYAYDSFSRIDQITYPDLDGATAKYEYSPKNGALQAVSLLSPAKQLWRATDWSAGGRIVAEKFGGGVVNTTYTLDPALESLSHVTTRGANDALLQDVGFEYTSNLDLKSRTDSVMGMSESMTYDNQRQLHTWSITSGSSTTSFEYGYDVLNNLRWRKKNGSEDQTFVVGENAGPHVLTSYNGTGVTHDSIGRRTTGMDSSLSYAGFDLPSSVTRGGATTTFQYDADHARALKDGPSGKILYLNGLFERRRTAAGDTDVLYIQGPGRVVAQIARTGVAGGRSLDTSYFHVDHAGSVDVVSDETGQAATHMKHDPWGVPIEASDPASWSELAANSTVHLGFTGQEEDREIRLVNLNGRLYEPQTARFLSPDPVTASAKSSISFNRYAYARNNPLGFIDPTGFDYVAIDDGWNAPVAYAPPVEIPIGNYVSATPVTPTYVSGTADAGGFCTGAVREGWFGPEPQSPEVTAFQEGMRQYEAGLAMQAELAQMRAEFQEMARAQIQSFMGPRPTFSSAGLTDLHTWTNPGVQANVVFLLGVALISPPAGLAAAGMELLWSGPGAAGAEGAATVIAARGSGLPGSALVCRGGLCTAERFAQGSGVTLDASGRLQGVSVNSAPEAALNELTSTFRNKQVGVTTVDQVRAAGGSVTPSPGPNSPFHCTLCDLTPAQAEQLFTPTVRNPNIP